MSIHPNYRDQSFDCLLHSLMTRKRKLASSALWPMGDTSNDTSQLQDMLAAEALAGSLEDAVKVSILKMFERDGLEPTEVIEGRKYIYQ